ncbi:TetR/AcrR family transcriptional regulator [Rhodococcus sp. PAMC28707]|uniref:TetR/AcrR family transcriptional regulator n=1 Tax=unclassified Rhodococcus (in: high G+C Gram-positive bacteria) TaxID=192944 RepID=UPI00109E2AE8|nr:MULTISPECIES: helix-turn-helix domain-containing protein [unclassified Rhodococcus (in: high G+C Gram-positive bacteria)]QCB49944.1 TetR/AcrR family transcriptional regulator [Rhodococcus sp. PAMC28705]QCB58363.1 TetR/AcrR family transcriptional regulator [Rhodococcus sp. PAMC28707]
MAVHQTGPAISAVPDLRERRRRETRREISEAALDLFELHGAASTTVDDIARRAGVSPSTFFRSFANKEESVLIADIEFEAEFTEWLESSASERVTLAAIENIYERSVVRFVTASEDSTERLLRVRRLVLSDAQVRSAAYAADAVMLACLTEKVSTKLNVPSTARLLIETAALTLRIAVDRWAEVVDGGDESADLVTVYRAVRSDLRRLVRD